MLTNTYYVSYFNIVYNNDIVFYDYNLLWS